MALSTYSIHYTTYIYIRVPTAMDRIRQSNTDMFATKYYKSLVVPMLVQLPETWTLLTGEKRSSTETKRLGRLLQVSYTEAVALYGVRSPPTWATMNPYYNSEVVQADLVLRLALKGSRCRCGKRKNWFANLKEWTSFHEGPAHHRSRLASVTIIVNH